MKNQNENQEVDGKTSLPISITDLTKTYGKVFALNSVSIEVEAGEFLTLLGPSGSGKTTLLMAIAGFNRPDSGSIVFGKKEMILMPPHKRDVGMVFQNYALFPHMSVFENVAFPLKIRQVALHDRKMRVAEALDTVQLSDFANRRIDQLSGGQRQRVALARAFVFRPRILLMDEPLSALDKKLREQMQIELKQLHRQLGVTTVYVTHDQREALTMSDRIAVINDGKITQLGTPKQIYNAPSNSFVADFIGESSVIPLEIGDSDKLFFQKQEVARIEKNQSHRLWSLVIRPERLTPISANKKHSKNFIIFKGKITELVFQGETALAIVQLPQNYSLSMRYNTKAAGTMEELAIGQLVSMSLDKNDVIIIPRES